MAEPRWEVIDLVRLLEQTIGFYDDALKKAGLVVKRAYLEDHVPIISDGGRLHQIFANLLGNAIKYALPGTRIYLTLVKVPEGWRVRLLNTASYEMDFDPEEIVQRFARGDKARVHQGQRPGTGHRPDLHGVPGRAILRGGGRGPVLRSGHAAGN